MRSIENYSVSALSRDNLCICVLMLGETEHGALYIVDDSLMIEL